MELCSSIEARLISIGLEKKLIILLKVYGNVVYILKYGYFRFESKATDEGSLSSLHILN